MWSVGCIFGELVMGAALFQGDSEVRRQAIRFQSHPRTAHPIVPHCVLSRLVPQCTAARELLEPRRTVQHCKAPCRTRFMQYPNLPSSPPQNYKHARTQVQLSIASIALCDYACKCLDCQLREKRLYHASNFPRVLTLKRALDCTYLTRRLRIYHRSGSYTKFLRYWARRDRTYGQQWWTFPIGRPVSPAGGGVTWQRCEPRWRRWGGRGWGVNGICTGDMGKVFGNAVHTGM